jgi:hypothetical protein
MKLTEFLDSRDDRTPPYTILWSAEGRDWLIEIDTGFSGDRVICVGFSVRSFGSSQALRTLCGFPDEHQTTQEVTASLVRGLPVGSLTQRAISGLMRMLEATGRDAELFKPLIEETRKGPKRGRPTLYDDDHWARVAEVYSREYAAGGHPTKKVAEVFKVNRHTAAKWVATSRRRGFLGQTTPRRAGGAIQPK